MLEPFHCANQLKMSGPPSPFGKIEYSAARRCPQQWTPVAVQ